VREPTQRGGTGRASGALPTRLGSYRIESSLGRGGLGEVFLGVHELTGQHAAVKRLLPHVAAKPRLVRLFEREYHTLAQLKHPRIIEVYEYGVDPTGCYYSMELLGGSDVRDLAPLDIRQACSVLRDVASSLALLHVRRLIHRDVSPRNVRLTTEGRAKLIDFGALTTFGRPTDVVGTPVCTAPEVLRREPLDHRADLYSLGVVAYYALTGKYPFTAEEFEDLPDAWQVPITPLRTLRPEVPPALEELVLSLLRQDPMSRPASTAEVIERFTAIGNLPHEQEAGVADAYLQSSTLVGRDRQIGRLRHRLQRALDRHGGYVVLQAATGAGKTRLLTALSVEAQLEGATVLTADGAMAEGPYGVAKALLASLLVRLRGRALAELGDPLSVVVACVPELAEHLPQVSPAALPDEPAEQRALLQEALAECFVQAAGSIALVLLVDDLHAADEESLALLAGLAFEARDKRLLLVGTLTPELKAVAQGAVDGLEMVAETVRFGDLSAADVEALVHGIFGQVGGAARLAAWLHEVTQGNPLQCMELAQHLVRQGVIRYVEGTWALPTDLRAAELPASVEEARRARLDRLSTEAREVAEALSISRLAVSIESCAGLTGIARADRLFALLDELVTAGVLVSRGSDYQFAQAAVREALERQISLERRPVLHARAAAALLEQSEGQWGRRMEAGWHLIHAGSKSEGADVLLDAASFFARHGFGLAMSVDALETTLAIYDEERRSDYELCHVLYALMQAALYVDHRLGPKYGARAIEIMRRVTGVGAAQRLSRFVGAKVGLLMGVTWAFLRRAMWRDRRAHRSNTTALDFPEFMAAMSGMLAYLAGVAATVGDADTLDQVEETVALLGHLSHTRSPWLVHSVSMHVILSGRGHHAQCVEWCLRELGLLANANNYQDIPPGPRNQLLGGALITLALNEAWRTSSDTFEYCDRLEETGVQMMGVYAHAARFHYYMLRGEWTKAKEHMARLELHAARGGTTWQAELFIDNSLIEAVHMLGDVAALRRMRERLARFAATAPPLQASADLARAAHLCLRGMPDEAIEVGRQLQRRIPASLAGARWSAHALMARALNQAGRHVEAAAECQLALSDKGPGHDTFGPAPFDVRLQLIRAEMELGRHDQARRGLEKLMAERAATANPVEMGLLYRMAAELALRVCDREAFADNLSKMEAWVRPTENPALIAQWELVRDRGAAGGMQPPRDSRTTLGELPTADDARVVAIVEALRECHSSASRFAKALEILLEHAGARHGSLYVVDEDGLRLGATSRGFLPPPDLELRLSEMVQSMIAAEGERSRAMQSQVAQATTVPLSRYSYTDVLVGHLPVMLSTRDGPELTVVGVAALRRDDAQVRLPPLRVVHAVTGALAEGAGVGVRYGEP
jgi:hypothetical protein